MVLSAFYGQSGGSHTAHQLEIDRFGAVLHDLDTGLGGLDRSSDAAVDASGRTYAASVSGLLEIATDFSAFQVLPYSFSRASGVAISANNRLFVTDQAANKLLIFDQTRHLISSSALGLVPTGLDFDGAGQLFAASFLDGKLLNVTAGTARLTGINEICDVEFADDDGYYVAFNRGGMLAHYSAANQLLTSTATGAFSDSIAIFPATVPEPATWILAILGVATAVGKWLCRN